MAARLSFYARIGYAFPAMSLNAAQQAAVQHDQGPLLIIAGAGTGKTTVIVERIAHMIATKKAAPSQILALTFTDKATEEMIERVDRALPIGVTDVQIYTFHGLCEKLLREFGIEVGLSSNFRVANDVDGYMLLKKHLFDFDIDYLRPRTNPTKFFKDILRHISRAKDEGITAQMYADHVATLTAKDFVDMEPKALALELQKYQELSYLYAQYEERMQQKGWLDFGSLLLETREMLRSRPNILAKLRDRFRYIIVDEFQDTNSVQYDIVKLLAGELANLTVVGDDDQAIYRFRGAALRNILQFRQDFPQAARVVLTENYRSAKPILDAAYRAIQVNNPHRLEITENISKQLQSQAGQGEITHRHFESGDDEVEFVVNDIVQKVRAGMGSYQDMCILARSNAALEPFIEALERLRIPYRVTSQGGLYTQPVVLDILAWFRVLLRPHDDMSWYRVVTQPTGGFSDADTMQLFAYAKKHAVRVFDLLTLTPADLPLSTKAHEVRQEILAHFASLRDALPRMSAAELYAKLVREVGFLGYLVRLSEQEELVQMRILNLFFRRIKTYVAANPDHRWLQGFMDEFDAEREAGEDGTMPPDVSDADVVTLLTVHASKGLEFDSVYVVNLVEQRFPSSSRSDALPLPPRLVPDGVDCDNHLAEERRLFYVALTRGKSSVTLCSAQSYGGDRARKVSRFVGEAIDHVQHTPTPSGKGLEEDIAAPLAQERPPSQQAVYYSFSQLAAYETCPLQYKYAHIVHVPSFGNEAQSYGTSLHNTLEHVFRHIQNDGDIPALAIFDQLYDEHFIGEWYPSPEQREKRYTEGRAALHAFRQYLQEHPPRPAFLEAAFHVDIDGVLLKGRIDRVDITADGQGYEIFDYKTGDPKDELDWRRKRQLVLYALAVQNHFSPQLPVTRVTYVYLGDTVATRSFTPSEKDFLKLRDEVVKRVHDIESGDFTAKPGMMCRYCDFKNICPFSVDK